MKKTPKNRNKDTDTWYPSEKELKRLRPIAETDPELLAAHKAGTLKFRGRPKLENKKELVSLRLDPEVLHGYKASGKGWQSRMNQVLKDGLSFMPTPSGTL